MNARIALCAGGVLVCATAATMLVKPEPVAGQSADPRTYRQRHRSPYAATSVAAPAQRYGRRQPNPPSQPPQSSRPRRESAVQRQLRALYQRNGQQMPNMNLQSLPKNPQAISAQTRNLRKRRGGVPKRSKPGLLERLFSFGRKKPKRDVAPRPVTPPQRPAPRYRQPATGRPVPRTPYGRRPLPGRFSPKPQPFPTANRQRGVPASNASQSNGRNTKSNDGKIPLLIDERKQTPKQITTEPPAKPLKKAPAPPKETTDGFPNPFPELSEEEADAPKPIEKPDPQSTDKPKPKIDKPKSQESPFTGAKLTDDEPENPPGKVTLKAEKGAEESADPHPLNDTPKPQPKKRKQPPALRIKSAQDLHNEHRSGASGQPDNAGRSSREEKLKRIAERQGLTGFRGFCPVVLRNQRELVDAKLQFRGEFEGRTYYFSSAAAKGAFDLAPEKYAPVSRGRDIIRLTEDSHSVEGSLEHAVWFRNRLYFFESAKTLRKFVKQPKKYAVTR